MRFPEVRNWLEINSDIFAKIELFLTSRFPHLAEYMSSFGHKKFFGSFSTLALNMGVVTDPHRDCNDLRHGLCCIMPFGSFKGGELFFQEMDMSFQVQSGDLILFRSSEMLHGNFDIEEGGERNSLVFFFDNNLQWSLPNSTDAAAANQLPQGQEGGDCPAPAPVLLRFRRMRTGVLRALNPDTGRPVYKKTYRVN